jgi:hypothetical protein
MAAAAGEAGRTVRLQPAAGVVVAGTLLVKQPLLRWAATVGSLHRLDRVSTFKASRGRLAQVTVITGISAGAAVAARQMRPLQPLAAGRCSVVVVAARAVEQAQFLRQPARQPAAALAPQSAAGARRAFLARHLHPATQAGRLTATMAVRVVVVAVQPCRLQQTAQQAVQVVLEAVVAVAVVVAAIRDSVVLVVLVVPDIVS